MILANYHTHTPRCKHAVGSEREYVEKAIEEGFQILGFSDHVPQPYPKGFVSGIRMDMDELEDYTITLSRLKEEYRDQIQILIGYEVEYFPKYFETLMRRLKKYPIDYAILGQHHVPDEIEGFYVGFPTDKEDELRQYVDLTIEGMKTGLFTYLAHPDLIRFTGPENLWRRHMERLVGNAIDLGMPLEVNVYGFIDGRQYPSDRFFRLASEMGAEFVIGCDAHKTSVLTQPEKVPGFEAFLQRNHVVTGDNVMRIRSFN